MVKELKILGDSFKHFTANGTNTFIDNGIINKISPDNIKELIKNFVDSKVKVFVYNKHKSDMSEEREPIGEILNLSACDNEIGLKANIYFNDEGQKLLEKGGFYPSIEMSGVLETFDNNIRTWSNCILKALACVEYPASSNVDLLCLSGIIEYNQNKELNMNEKLDELVKQFEATGQITPELLDVAKSDDTLLGVILELAMKAKTAPASETTVTETETVKQNDDGSTTTTETKTEEPKTDGEVVEEEKKTETTLSMIDWQNACKKVAQKEGFLDVALSGVENTLEEANKLYKAGVKLNRIVEIEKSKLSFLGGIKKEEAVVDLSAVKEEDALNQIGAMFK